MMSTSPPQMPSLVPYCLHPSIPPHLLPPNLLSTPPAGLLLHTHHPLSNTMLLGTSTSVTLQALRYDPANNGFNSNIKGKLVIYYNSNGTDNDDHHSSDCRPQPHIQPRGSSNGSSHKLVYESSRNGFNTKDMSMTVTVPAMTAAAATCPALPTPITTTTAIAT